MPTGINGAIPHATAKEDHYGKLVWVEDLRPLSGVTAAISVQLREL